MKIFSKEISKGLLNLSEEMQETISLLENPIAKLDSDRIEKIYDQLFSELGISLETVDLSKEEWGALTDYLYICELMVRCKESAMRVSPQVWAGIESRMVTAPLQP